MSGIRSVSLAAAPLNSHANGMGMNAQHLSTRSIADVHNPDDPNTSYELRDMVSVAASYFERGMLEDAAELLQEALDAGYSRPDGIELRRRIRSVQGLPSTGDLEPATTDRQDDPAAAEPMFTRPLPGTDTQPAAVRRAIGDSDTDIEAGRIESAYDAAMTALALAPTFMPIYVRLAELHVARGDSDGAAELIRSLRECLARSEADDDWLVRSLQVILDPDDIENLVELARLLLQLRGTVALEPYVPGAIERVIDSQPDVALELAEEFARLQPQHMTAHRLHLRAIVAGADDDRIRTALKRDVGHDSSADLLFLRAAVSQQESRDEWFRWLELAVTRLRARLAERDLIPSAIESARRLMPEPQHGLSAAILRLAIDDPHGALTCLSAWSGRPGRSTSDAREMLIAASARAIALRQSSPVDSIGALSEAVGQAVVIDVRPFAETTRLLGRSIAAESLMQELVTVARETGQSDEAIERLRALRDRLPEHLEIRAGLADLQIAAGRINEGVRELRHVAERYEKSGNLDRMVEAMRHISNAVPNNTEMKAKLIEGYIQRGFPDEAMRELQLLGELHLRRNRPTDAAAAFTRGAEIAATTGDVRRAMELFDQAVGCDADNVAVRHASVAFYIMNGAVDKAVQQLREVVRIALSQDDPDEAVAALHQTIGLAPGDAAAYHKLGEVLTSVGEYTQAQRVYRRLSTITPDDPVLSAKQSALAALAAEQ